MSVTLYDLLMKAGSPVTKSDIAELHDPATTAEREQEILEALAQTGYENLPD